jgi:hypothetical protein
MSIAIVDGDFIKYTAGGASEKRIIRVTNKLTGEEFTFNTRTEFCGRGDSVGGWLAKENVGKETPLMVDDFIVEDVQIAEPEWYSKRTAKVMLQGYLENSGADSYIGYIGKGDSFRVGQSTIWKYKGSRDKRLKPKNLDAIEKCLIEEFGFHIVQGIEADDMCVMQAYKNPDKFIIGVDKDYYGCPVRFYNINKPEEGIIDCDCFGTLYIGDKGKVRGYGRMFLYFQIAYGDLSDEYKANSANPSYEFGEKSAYKALKDCKTDKEALAALVGVYKQIYPEPKVITGWRGDRLLVDWFYVMNENFNMARMLRFDNDDVNLKTVLERYGLYE